MHDFYDPNDSATKAYFVERKIDETISLYNSYISENVMNKYLADP